MNSAPEAMMWWRLGVTLVLETTLLCLAALALRALARSAVGRRALWQITTVGLAALVACELTGASRGLLGWVFAPAEPKSPAPVSTRTAVAVVLDTPTLPSLTDMVPANPAPTPPPAAPRPRLGWPGLIWLGGFALVALLLALGRLVFVLVWRRRRVSADPALAERVQELARQLGIRRRVQLTEAAGLTGPIAFGIVRPEVCLPPNFTSDFSPTQQDAMLAHELAHLAAGDPVWHGLADAVTALLWWQPLAWWIRRKLRAASETAADEASLLIENGPHALAECLVVLGRQLSQRRSLGWLGVDGGGFRSNLGKRVERLVHLSGQPWRPARRTSVWTAKTLGPLALVLIIIAGTAWTQPREAKVKDLKEAWQESVAGLAMSAMWSRGEPAKPAAGDPATDDFSEALSRPAPIPWQPWSPEAVLQAQAEGRPVLVSFTAEWCLAALTNEWTSLEIPAVRARLREINAVALRGDATLGDAAIDAELRRFGRTNVPLVLVYSTNFGAPPVVLPEVLTPEMVLAALNQAMLPPVKPANDSRAQRGFEYTVRPGDTLSVIVKSARDRGVPLTVEQVRQANPNVDWSRLRVGQKVFLPAGESPEAGALRRESLDKASNLVDDGKRLYEAGKLHEARSQFERALALDPANERAKLYLRLLEQREKTRPSPTNAPLLRPAAPTQPAQTNTVRMNARRKALFDKLDQIILEDVAFDAAPLSAVLTFLSEQCKARDPQRRGVNFMINLPLQDPDALHPPAELNDLSHAVIRIQPPLRNVSLRQVLGAIVVSASKPLTYRVEDYAVVFSAPESPLLYTRVFKLDPNIFLKNLRELAGAKASPERKEKGSPSGPDEIVYLIRTVFMAAAGVELDPPKNIFFNDRLGQLLVRATREDLDVIERLVQRLNLAPPQVTVDTKIVEMPDEDGQALEWFRRTVHVLPATTNQAPETPIGILTDPQYREAIRSLEQSPGIDLLKMPRVTTLSGRQLQQKVVDVKYVVTNLQIDVKGTATSTNGMPGFRPVTESFELGPVVDVVPCVLADGLSFQLTVIVSVREFIGYDMGPDNWGAPLPQPKPAFLFQQALGRATVFDGQTVCLSLGSFTHPPTTQYKYNVPFLGEMPVMGPLFKRESTLTRQRHRFVFVTPTIIDPAGNRVHTEEKIPNSIPPQATPPTPR